MGKHFEETEREKRKKAKKIAKIGKRAKIEPKKKDRNLEKALEALELELKKEANVEEYKMPNFSTDYEYENRLKQMSRNNSQTETIYRKSSSDYEKIQSAFSQTNQSTGLEFNPVEVKPDLVFTENNVDTKHEPNEVKAKPVKQSKIQKKRDQRKKNKVSNFLLGLLAVICIGMLVYSGIHIYGWFRDNGGIEEEAEQALNQVEIQEVVDDENVKVVESKEEKTSPYWEYIKMNLMDVDFSELEKTNSDVQGWIQVNGTNINYPFVQTTDNSYYLTHSFLKEYNEAGWVFLDYRNNIKNLDKNTIIYAHSRLDKAMFGSLKNLLESNWYENKNNHIIKMSTKTENTLWQVFSVYHLPTTSDYLRTTFSSGSDFKQFTQMLQDRSVYDFDATVNENDKILTLSTCYKTDEKMVMHAKLIKYSPK